MVKLSIIVPVYNVGPFVRECLESIRRQTFREWECLLIDDGSTDESGRICRRFCAQDPRFRYFYQENSGVSSARNRGIGNAAAEFLTFVDPDDRLSHRFYEILFEEQERHNADIVQGSIIDISEDGTENPVYKQFEAFNEVIGEQVLAYSGAVAAVAIGTDEVMQQILSNNFNCLSWNKIYKRSLWVEARFPEELSLGEDMAVVIGVVARANVAVATPRAFYYYRNRRSSLLHSDVNVERLQEDLRGSGMMKKQLLAVAPDRQEEIKTLKLQYDVGCMYQFVTQKRNGSKLAALCEALSYMDEYGSIDHPVRALGTFCRDIVSVFTGNDSEETT